MPIRKQMIILLTIMSVVPFGLICYSALAQRTHEIAKATAITDRVASQIQNEQSFLLAGSEQLAATLGQLPEVRKHDSIAVNSLLAAILKTNSNYYNIIFVDRSGSLWASALPAKYGLSLADRRYFKHAIASGKMSAGEYAISKVGNDPIFSFGYPVTNQSGAITDVLVISLALDNYRHLYPAPTSSPISAILLADHRGTILYSSVAPKLVGKQDRSDLFKQMVEGPDEGNFEARGNIGIHRFYSYKKLRLKGEATPYMYVRTGLSTESVLSRVNRDFLFNVAILSLAVLVSLAVVLYACKRGVYDKIVAIRDATRRISRGELDTRIADTVSGGEFGELATAFDTMAEKLSADARNLSQAYEAQRESESKYRELVEKANSIILKWDRDGRVTYFNEFAETFFGFSSSEIIGQELIGTIVPETESSGRNLVDMIRIICTNPAAFINNENENSRKNGERVWISWNNHPLADADGEIVGVLSVGQDITERKRIEGELQKSEQRFRSFVENVNDVLFALTPSGIFSYVSPQWKVAFGYELSETIGQPFVPFVHPDDVPSCFAFLQRVFETGKKQSGVEYRVLCKDGTYLWYKANASLIFDPVNGAPTLVGIGRDITERKEAEKTLRQSEEKFSAAFRASPDAVTLSRLSDGAYLDVNEGFTTITGYQPEEVLGRTSEELQLWLDPEKRLRLLQELMEHGIAKDVDARFRRKDGTILVGQLSARIIEINNEPYILGITRDITEREHIQKEILKAQKLESISILAGGIAHNFNNVLTGVIGYISYAKKHLTDSDKVLHILESAEKSSYRAADLARQLLTFSQGCNPVRKPVAVDTLVQESVSLFLSGTNIKGIIDCSSRQTIHVDSQQINQVFNNIVLNAIQAMPDGGTLTVRADAVTLKTGNKFTLQPATYVQIVFEDTGQGIHKDDLGKIFDPYFTTKACGTGLGLSTTHSIVSKHGGFIDISSEVGKGTTVTILLPASAEEHPENIRINKLEACNQADVSILVMDDEEMIRQLAGEILHDLGYEVATCCNGEEAIALFKASLEAQRPFSIVIMDLVIPGGMGGIEAARHILDLAPQACLIASSGYSNDPAIAEYTTYGFSETIIKPYNADELSRALQNVLLAGSND